MENYSLIERLMLLLYNNIEGRYSSDGEFIIPVIFLVIIYLEDY